MIIVYYEKHNGSWAHEVARFVDEETYNLCWSTLYKQAQEEGVRMTDSLVGGDENQYPFTSEEIKNLKEGL
tara:strand:+ start:231 stop:443 length:213 start_codon:yes stop_codon:yes gene_type:complete